MKYCLHISKKSSTFVAFSKKWILKIINDMDTLLKNLGAILVLLGVICLAIYYFGVQENALLVVSMVLEVAGLFAHVLLNKRYQ